jgi:hypothetical protein
MTEFSAWERTSKKGNLIESFLRKTQNMGIERLMLIDGSHCKPQTAIQSLLTTPTHTPSTRKHQQAIADKQVTSIHLSTDDTPPTTHPSTVACIQSPSEK